MSDAGQDAGGPSWRPAVLWHRDGGRLVCDLCPSACVLPADGPGACRVRRRRGGVLETATFASAVRHWQPVERKPLYHFRPGLPTLTLAAPGCTFRCDYCLNAPLSQYGRDANLPWAGAAADPAALVAAAAARGAAIALSYSEPGLAAELTLALHRAAQAQGGAVPILWKSNGYLTRAALDLLAPCLAAVNVDLKCADDASHRRLTGAPLAPVLATLEGLRGHGVWLEVSTPLIHGINDRPAAIRAMARRVLALGPETPWHLVRFLPEHRLAALPPTPPALLADAVAMARDLGLRHVYVERALGDAGRRTCCPGCGAALIERGRWRLNDNRLHGDGCPACGRPLAGVWS
jgi:pyruvate formate lyase activating enzyme